MKLENTKRNYVGKNVFVGIDVHKKTYAITVRCDSEIVKKFSQKADPDQLANSLLDWFAGAKITAVYEAGFSGFGLCRTLERLGIKCIVVNAASVEVQANNRVKTDKRDSAKLAEKLEKDDLDPIFVPTVQEELDRQYQRTRGQVVKSRCRVANQLKGKLHEFGLLDPDDDQVVSKKFIAKIKLIKMPPELRFSVDIIISQWEHLTTLIKDLDSKVREQANQGNRTMHIIKSAPGIGPISAVTIATEIVSFLRFRNEGSIFAFLGLTPREYSSGEHRRQGNITKQGSNRLRGILTEAAWRAIKSDKSLLDKFERIAARQGKKKAIVAIARTLVGRIRSCIWNNQDYKIVALENLSMS